MSKHETRFNADAWVQVWITEDELKLDKTIFDTRGSNYTDEMKIKLMKARAQQIAMERAQLLTAKGVEITTESFDIDTEFNNIDWESLL